MQSIYVFLQLLGDWFEGSGWKNALVEAEIASPDTIGSFSHASHVTTTRHAHQITAASLYKLFYQAYNEHCTSEAAPPTFEDWCLQEPTKVCISTIGKNPITRGPHALVHQITVGGQLSAVCGNSCIAPTLDVSSLLQVALSARS